MSSSRSSDRLRPRLISNRLSWSQASLIAVQVSEVSAVRTARPAARAFSRQLRIDEEFERSKVRYSTAASSSSSPCFSTKLS